VTDDGEIATAAQEFEAARAHGEYFPSGGLTGSARSFAADA
jgi:hypothetical protein